jgi:hypothetical protein
MWAGIHQKAKNVSVVLGRGGSVAGSVRVTYPSFFHSIGFLPLIKPTHL